MKSVEQVLDILRRRVATHWHDDVTDPGQHWPYRVPLTPPSSAAADTNRSAVRAWAHRWHDWAAEHQLTLALENRRISGLAETLPTHLHVPNLDTAARLIGHEWPNRISTARARHTDIAHQFPNANRAAAVRAATSLTDIDFGLALQAAQWFLDHPKTEWRHLTPRQIPIAGLHGKWLNNHRPLLQALTGLPDLKLATRPTQIDYTYCDPTHLACGGRRHDSYTLGDTATPAYNPELVLICENKDTVVLFPALPGLIVIQGNGQASIGQLPQVPWLRNHPHVYYWGDLDARGFEILNGLRREGITAQALFMDRATYNRYQHFGTNHEPNGEPIQVRQRVTATCLTDEELALYEDLTDPDWTGHRRFEQERVPIQHAAEALQHTHATRQERGL